MTAILVPTCGRDARLFAVLREQVAVLLPEAVVVTWDDPEDPMGPVDGCPHIPGKEPRGGHLRGRALALECAQAARLCAPAVVIRMDADVVAGAAVLTWLAKARQWRFIERPDGVMRGMLWAADQAAWKALVERLEQDPRPLRTSLMSEIHADALTGLQVAHESLPPTTLAHVLYHDHNVPEAGAFHCGLRGTMHPALSRGHAEWIAQTMTALAAGSRQVPPPPAEAVPWWMHR
jgi:hypothetical protein